MKVTNLCEVISLIKALFDDVFISNINIQITYTTNINFETKETKTLDYLVKEHGRDIF